jgi:hypothetical protein
MNVENGGWKEKKKGAMNKRECDVRVNGEVEQGINK